MIELTIKTLDSQNHKFRVPDCFTILDLKEHIAEQVKIAINQQRLIFCGRVMSNETKLADIGIDGKVMHLVQKVPRLATTTSGSSSSTTTNTNSRSGQNGGPGFRGFHAHDPTVLFGAIGIPSEFMHAGELPRLISARGHGTGNRVLMAMDMIRRSNELLNRLENPRTTGRPSASDAEQFPEGPQQPEDGNVHSEATVPESSTPQTQSDPDLVNVSYEVDESFPNTVVVTIDATHHVRVPPGLMRQVHNYMQANNSNSPSQNPTEQGTQSEATTASETASIGLTNQTSAEEAAGTLPSSATSEQNLRNDRPTTENRATTAINDRRRLRELIEQLNKLNTRLQPFYVQFCQYISEDPRFESIEGENGSYRAQTVYNVVSEVMHYISHIYHAISDLRIAFARTPPRSIQSRPCVLQGTILHTAHSVTTSSAAPPPSTQQPTSTQTTTTSQSIPSVRAFRLDVMNPEGVGSETSNVSSSATSTETNTNMTVDPNPESNNTSSEFPETPRGIDLMFDLAPGTGTIRIDSVEASFVTPNASGSSQPTAVSQASNGNETPNNMSMPIDWMDQMIDVISSGVRRPFMADQSLDWSSIPTTSTRTPRVTPRTTDSSSTTNPPSQGLPRGRWDTVPRMDPFLPCSSHHFESNLRPMVLARRSAQGTDRSTSANSGSSTTDSSTPTSPIEMRPYPGRRQGRARARFLQEPDGFLSSGIHPILTWGRNHRNNSATTSASNNAQTNGQGTGIESVILPLHTLDNMREVHIDRARDLLNAHSPTISALNLASTISASPQSILRRPHDFLVTPIANITLFSALENRLILMDLFLLIARNWNLNDIINLNSTQLESSIVQNPVSRNSEALVNFILDRVMLNRPSNNIYIEDAANRIYEELSPILNMLKLSTPSRLNVDVSASFHQCINSSLRGIVIHCEENRAGASNDIVSSLIILAKKLLSLYIYCCNSLDVFRRNIASLTQLLPLPTTLRYVVADEIRRNVSRYWAFITNFQILDFSVNDIVVPNSVNREVGQTSTVGNEEQSSNLELPSSEIVNESLPEVVIGSQEWHHSVPSEWVPVIARDSQRQRRQGTQPPYSDAYLSGMPNKRRKIVANSKPQGPLSQIIAKNLEVAMGAAGVSVNKEVTASVGADTAVQNAYTERIRTFGRSGLDTHPNFCPNRYPNASKFFYDHNRPN